MKDIRNLVILAVVGIIVTGGFSYYALDGVDITPQVAQVSTTMTSVSCAGLSSDITKIYNVTDFAKIQKDIKNGIRDKHYILCNGLNLGGSDDYVPENAWFEGTFDGNGKKLINFHTNPSSNRNNQGLFALIGERGVVKNLILETPNVVNPSSVSVGLIAGENKGAIQNIEIRNKVPWVWIKVRGKENVGGIAGKNHSTGVIRNIKIPEGVYLSVEGITRYAGGIAGTNAGTIGNITSMGTYSVTVPTLAGGIAGYNTGTISDTQTYTYVIATNKKAGGIAGEIGGGLIEYSRSGREVRGGDLTGGIVGAYSGGKIHGSYSDSVLKDTDDINNDLKVAGIAGGVSSNSNFTYVAYNNVKRICSGCTAIDNLAYGEAPWTCSAKSFPLPLAKPDMCAGGGSSSDDMMSSDDYSSTVTLKAGTSLEKQEVYCRGDCDGYGTYICDKNTKQWKEVENTCMERKDCPAKGAKTQITCGKAQLPEAAHGTPFLSQCPGGCEGIVEAKCMYGDWVGNYICENPDPCAGWKGTQEFNLYWGAFNNIFDWDAGYWCDSSYPDAPGDKCGLPCIPSDRGDVSWCALASPLGNLAIPFNGDYVPAVFAALQMNPNKGDYTADVCAVRELGIKESNLASLLSLYAQILKTPMAKNPTLTGATFARTEFIGSPAEEAEFYSSWLSGNELEEIYNSTKFNDKVKELMQRTEENYQKISWLSRDYDLGEVPPFEPSEFDTYFNELATSYNPPGYHTPQSTEAERTLLYNGDGAIEENGGKVIINITDRNANLFHPSDTFYATLVRNFAAWSNDPSGELYDPGLANSDYYYVSTQYDPTLPIDEAAELLAGKIEEILPFGDDYNFIYNCSGQGAYLCEEIQKSNLITRHGPTNSIYNNVPVFNLSSYLEIPEEIEGVILYPYYNRTPGYTPGSETIGLDVAMGMDRLGGDLFSRCTYMVIDDYARPYLDSECILTSPSFNSDPFIMTGPSPMNDKSRLAEDFMEALQVLLIEESI